MENSNNKKPVLIVIAEMNSIYFHLSNLFSNLFHSDIGIFK